jgi:glycosyltransferase involved in cell wall biosynthesis
MCIGPALSEFNPNFILESLSLGKPVLLTKGNGLSVTLPEEFLFDPFDKKELENKMLNMFDKNCYPNMVEIVDSLPLNQSWDVVTDTHISIVKDVIMGKKI